MGIIVKHKRTGKLYRILTESFSVERQAHSVVYMQLETGYVFDRDKDVFYQNFEILTLNVQPSIIPNNPDRK